MNMTLERSMIWINLQSFDLVRIPLLNQFWPTSLLSMSHVTHRVYSVGKLFIPNFQWITKSVPPWESVFIVWWMERERSHAKGIMLLYKALFSRILHDQGQRPGHSYWSYLHGCWLDYTCHVWWSIAYLYPYRNYKTNTKRIVEI